MTGSRELTALQNFRDLAGSSAAELQTNALISIAISLAAIADLYEMELLTALDGADGDPDDDEREDVTEAYPS